MAKRIFRLGDRVRIKTGPFASFTGRVEGINQSKALLKVMVDIFGRNTPINISFLDAEKLKFDAPKNPGITLN
jgi:transcription termination/antitermination protein NusG